MTESNKMYNVSEKQVDYEIPKKFKEGLMFVAEAPGQDEDQAGHPLVGKAGEKFNNWLQQTNINRSDCIIANTFRFRPEANKIEHFFVTAKLAKEQEIETSSRWPKHSSKALIRYFESELDYLYEIITKHKPKVVVPMGSVALWGCLKQASITQVQGNPVKHIFRHKTRVHECWVIPTFHPASVFPNRRPENEPLVLEALQTAKKWIEK